MQTIKITKRDIIWGYIAQFFSIGSGLITLPFILHKLTPEEIGMNYLMLSVGSFVSLIECGFSGVFGRNISYVLSGSQKLEAKGINTFNTKPEINYKVLATLIECAKFIYRRISLIVIAIMLTIGTGYIYHVTEGFTNIRNSLFIWLIYSASTYFNIYYLYYNSFLTGAAKIVESKKAMIYSKTVYIILCLVLIYCGIGLLSVVIANLVAPFISRCYSYVKFFTRELRTKLAEQTIEKKEIVDTYHILWYTAKQSGIIALGSYLCGQSGTFIAGLYLSLAEVSSYGLMLQLFSILAGVAQSIVLVYYPMYCKYYIQGNKANLLHVFSFSIVCMLLILTVGGLFIVLVGNHVLSMLGSQAVLPSKFICFFYFINILPISLHSACATFISAGNQLPYVKASIYGGISIVMLSIVSLELTGWGMVSLIVSPFVVHWCYNNWYWAHWVLRDLNVSSREFICCAMQEINNKIANCINK